MRLMKNMIVTELIAISNHYQKTKSYYVPEGHTHTLTFRTAGKKTILPEGGERAMVSGPGGITYLPSRVAYRAEVPEGGHMYSVHFHLYQEPEENKEALVFQPVSPVEYENLFRQLCENYRVNGENDYKCRALLYEILDKLFRELNHERTHAIPKRIRTAIEEINRNYADPELSVGALAVQADVSDVYFRREFARCVGILPGEYMAKVRMEHAKALLGTGLYPVAEVAIRCGFESISYFSQCFKRHFGFPPSKYMQMLRE